jgi:hypothetical protein
MLSTVPTFDAALLGPGESNKEGQDLSQDLDCSLYCSQTLSTCEQEHLQSTHR